MKPTLLTQEQLDLLPSDEDIAFYEEHGWYISKKIFSDAEIDAAVEGMEKYFARDVIDPGIDFPDWGRPRAEYGPGLRKCDYSNFWRPELIHIAQNPLLGAIAARLTGAPVIRLWHDQLLYKPADKPDVKSNVGWHTDRGYWKTCTSARMVTAWTPFHDCFEEMGTITMIDGSNHWPDNSEKLNFFTNDLEGLERQFDSGGRPVIKSPMNLKKGHASFHSCLTIHGSGPNHSPNPRRSMAVHLQDGDNHWREFMMKGGRLAQHPNDLICRSVDGVPDYSDPAVCPTIYVREE